MNRGPCNKGEGEAGAQEGAGTALVRALPLRHLECVVSVAELAVQGPTDPGAQVLHGGIKLQRHPAHDAVHLHLSRKTAPRPTQYKQAAYNVKREEEHSEHSEGGTTA